MDTLEIQQNSLVRLVDDDEAFLKSMKMMLEMMGWKVKGYSDPQRFLLEETFQAPGCIVLDLRMPGLTGLELQRHLEEKVRHSLPIIFLTGHGDVESAVHTLKHGAFDFLQKPVNPLVFNKTIEEACRKALGSIESNQEKIRALSAYKTLTPREKEVFLRAAKGLANKEISLELNIAVPTVKMHRANAFDKMSVHSSIEALNKLNLLGEAENS